MNQAKSGVVPASKGEFLSFGLTGGDKPKRRVGKKARERFRRRVKEITRRTRGVSLEQVVADLNIYLRGWSGYFGFCQTPSVLHKLDSWIRRRLRCYIWKQWKRGKTRYVGLRSRGLSKDQAAITAGSVRCRWRMSASPGMNTAFPITFFSGLGLISLEARCSA